VYLEDDCCLHLGIAFRTNKDCTASAQWSGVLIHPCASAAQRLNEDVELPDDKNTQNMFGSAGTSFFNQCLVLNNVNNFGRSCLFSDGECPSLCGVL